MLLEKKYFFLTKNNYMESRELLETLICVLCIISLVQIQVQVSFSLNQGYIQYLSSTKVLP